MSSETKPEIITEKIGLEDLESIIPVAIDTYCTHEPVVSMKWRSPRLSELTPVLSKLELTHLGSEASNFSVEMIIFFIWNNLEFSYSKLNGGLRA